MVVCGCSAEESEGERVTEMGLRCGRGCMCSTVHSHRARERREREREALFSTIIGFLGMGFYYSVLLIFITIKWPRLAAVSFNADWVFLTFYTSTEYF